MSNPNYPKQSGYTQPTRSKPGPNQTAAPVYRYTQQFLQEGSQSRLATWGPRLSAFLIDFVLVSIPFNVLGNLIWIQRAIVPSGTNTDSTNTDVTTIGLTYEFHNLLWGLVFGLYVLLATRIWGATVGNRMLNLEVVNADGAPLSRLLLFLRASLVCYAVVSSFIVWWGAVLPLKFDVLLSWNAIFIPGFFLGLGFFLVLFDPHKQTLIDKFFKSQVVIDDLSRI